MLRITKLTDYGIVLMSLLAVEPPETFLAASELSDRTGIGEATVGKLLKLLTKAKLLISQVGSQGGYALAQKADNINLHQIIAAIEGEIALTECDKLNAPCDIVSHCRLREPWQTISKILREALSEVSLADMQKTIVDEKSLKNHLTRALKHESF